MSLMSFSNNDPHVLFILLEQFVRWEISGQTTAILLGAANKILIHSTIV